ncbi:hypothetical protein Ddye_006318 [Dipteronia dyeriana]|uniref:RNase H type-1 domain-containing protein n=1 Tax=Dipteronia dyeriana TaxID=168575 RepID=A0AAE0CQF1_9ROSI|nr:hypothetical protein Ddye_006318 [Dipteronia dyeriana]
MYTCARLCKHKTDGGLGFHDISIFNRALLAKQVWRLISQSNSLAARVLKSIYFSDSSILQASCSVTSLFLWKTLIWGKDLLEARLQWRIKDGALVSINGDRWLPRPLTFKVWSPPLLDLNAEVKDLITAFCGRDIEIIQSSSARVGIDWKLTPPRMSKIKMDAAIDGVNGKLGIGIIIRSDAGKVLALVGYVAGSKPLCGGVDALGVVSLINNYQPPYAEIGVIIQDILALLNSCPNWSVGFAHREANMAAHSLAKLGLISSSDSLWREDVPPIIFTLIRDDCPDPL